MMLATRYSLNIAATIAAASYQCTVKRTSGSLFGERLHDRLRVRRVLAHNACNQIPVEGEEIALVVRRTVEAVASAVNDGLLNHRGLMFCVGEQHLQFALQTATVHPVKRDHAQVYLPARGHGTLVAPLACFCSYSSSLRFLPPNMSLSRLYVNR